MFLKSPGFQPPPFSKREVWRDLNYTTICPEKLSDGTLKFPSVLKSSPAQEIDENKFIISPVREIFFTY
jgi:hypothetical protein